MTEFYGAKVIINEAVKYVGEGEDPANNPYMVAYVKALKEIYQPERLNPEDHIVGDNKMICDSLNSVEIQRGEPEEVSPPNKSDQKK